MSEIKPPESPRETVALVVAGGVGQRMGTETAKQFLPLGGQPLLFHSLAVFDRHPAVTSLCVVADPAWHDRLRGEAPWTSLTKPLLLAEAGPERVDSVRNGLAAIRERALLVLVHDAARPFVTPEMIDATLAQARKGRGAVVARPVRETVKCVGEGEMIVETVDRRSLWIAETPQAFVFDVLWRAHEHVRERGLAVTDDAQAVEALGQPVAICPAATPNPKITVPEDLAVAETLLEALLASRAETAAS